MKIAICKFFLSIVFVFFIGSSVVHAQSEKKFPEDSIVELMFTEKGIRQTEKRFNLLDRMQLYQTPGVCITLVDDNEIKWTKGYGEKSIGSNNLIDNKTIFQSGSVSKFVTAVIVMHYVEKGVLDLDEDINNYLKSWEMPENKYNRNITLRQLLSHQSGLPGTNFARDKTRELPSLVQIIKAELPAKNDPALPGFEPGSKWSYSNIGYVLIQLILEDVLKVSFEEIAQNVIFKPLKMNSSTFNYPLQKKMQQEEAFPHENGEKRDAVQDSKARAQGGLMTTTNDLALLIIDIMESYNGKSEKLINQKSVKQMLNCEAEIPLQVFGYPFKMGLGAFLDINGKSISFLHPGQSYPGSTFLFVAFPETGQAAVIGVNGNKGELLQLEILASLVESFNYPSGQYFK